MERSGYFDDLTTNDINNFFEHTGNGFTSPFKALVGQSKKFFNFGMMPFRAGEALNRGFAFLTVRREFMSLIKKGQLLGIDGETVLKQADIDSEEFLRLVVGKAKTLALNMGKAGELPGLSGGFSVLFQFKQVLPKFLNVFETSQLRRSEKIGAALSLFTLYGASAVPFMADTFAGADVINRLIDDRPSKRDLFTHLAREGSEELAGFMQDLTPEFAVESGMSAEFYNKFFKNGLIAAATKQWTASEWNISNRVALGKFVSDSIEEADWTEAVVSIATMVDLYNAVEKTGSIELLNIPAWVDVVGAMGQGSDFHEAFSSFFTGSDDSFIMDALRGDRTLGNAGLFVLREWGKGVSSLGALSRAFDVSNREVLDPQFDPRFERRLFDTSSGRLVPVEDNPSRRTQLYLGITPGAIVEAFEAEGRSVKIGQALKKYRKNMVRKWLDAPKSGNAGIEIVAEYMQEIQRTKQYMRGLGIPLDSVAQDVLKSAVQTFLGATVRKYIPGVK